MAVYTTDFSGYTTGVQPSGWSKPWSNSATWIVTDVVGATGGKVLRATPSSQVTNALTIDGSLHLNSETTVRIKVASLPTNSDVGVLARVSGSAGSEVGYTAAIRYTGSLVGLRFIRRSGGATDIGSVIDVGGSVALTNADFYIKFRVSGGDLKARVWAYGASEPGTWTDEATDGSPIAAAGVAGLYISYPSTEADFDTLTTDAVKVLDVAATAGSDTSTIALVSAAAATVSPEATVGGDIADIVLALEPMVSIAATAGGDTGGLVLDNWRQASIVATAGGDASTFALTYYETASMASEIPQTESAFEGVENTFFDFQTSFPIAVAFTGEDLQVATFAVEIPILEVNFTSPYGESLNIVLPVLETAFTETDQGYGEFAATFPMLITSFVGGELLTESFEVVCVNARTKEHSTYTNFPFNSFARFNGVDLACSSTGIHALGGDLDGTADIDAELYFGLSDCGAAEKKRVDSVWVRTRLSTQIDVQIEYDEVLKTPRRVTNHSGSDGVQTLRARGSRGAEGNFIRVGLSNVSGSDFEVLDMEMDVVKLSGR